jgi:hypothetical protein
MTMQRDSSGSVSAAGAAHGWRVKTVTRLGAFAGCAVLLTACSVQNEHAASNAPVPVAALPEIEGVLDDPSPLPENRPLPDLTEEGVFVRGRQAPVILDTRVFDPQIAPVDIDAADARRVKVHLPLHTRPADEPEDGSAALRDFPMGGMLGAAVVDPSSLLNFSGLDRTGWVPPDPTLAVGPDHIVVTVNQSVAFYNKLGQLQFQQILGNQGTPGFFEPTGAGNFAFDPKCFYDHGSGRFVILALEVYTNQSYITIAMSDDSDPNGVWYKYRTDSVLTINGNTYWWDYPGLGFDDDAVYVTSNLFPLNDGGFGGAGFRAFDKADMLVGAPVDFWTTRSGQGASVQAAQHYGDNAADGGAAYFVQANGGSTLRVFAIEDPIGNPSLNSINVSVPSYSSAGDVPTQGGGSVFALNNRIMNVAWRDGKIYTTHAVSQGGVAKPRWYAIETNGWPNGGVALLDDVGTVDPGPGIEGFFPAIAVNDAGQVGLAYATSSSSQRIRFWITGRRPTDPPGSMGEPVLVRESNTNLSGDSGQRWGDYYDATLDPDGLTFWAIGQTQESGIGWDTRIARWSLLTDACGPADLAPPLGVLDLADINAFVAAFTANQAPADLAPPTGVWDLADITAFIAAFSAGCP